MTRAVILGGGFAGCAAADLISKKYPNWTITLLEKTGELGAGVRTRYYGGHPFTFGPRHFLTPYNEVYEYLDKILPLRKLDHSFYSYVESDGEFYSFPVSHEDIRIMPDAEKIYQELSQLDEQSAPKNLEEYWLMSAGRTLYEKFAKDYNKKMWQVANNSEIDADIPEWTSKGKVIYEKRGENFHDKVSAFPHDPNGYNNYFDISTRNTNVLLGKSVTSVDFETNEVFCDDGSLFKYDLIINTLSVDSIAKFKYGRLRYVGLDFIPIVLPIEKCLPGNTFFLYYSGHEKHKRIVEYKNFYNYSHKHTLIGLEIPSMNGKHYAMPIKGQQELHRKYVDEQPENVYNIGRFGSYRYIDIDDCIYQAMRVAEIL